MSTFTSQHSATFSSSVQPFTAIPSLLQNSGPTVRTTVSLKEPDRGTLPETSHEKCRLVFWVDASAMFACASPRQVGHGPAMALLLHIPGRPDRAGSQVNRNRIRNKGNERRLRPAPTLRKPSVLGR